jgi:hypothetical protein
LYRRCPDGSELLEEQVVIERRERDGRISEHKRTRQLKVLADDMPWIAAEFTRLAARSV